jgi:hypothetical protein
MCFEPTLEGIESEVIVNHVFFGFGLRTRRLAWKGRAGRSMKGKKNLMPLSQQI